MVLGNFNFRSHVRTRPLKSTEACDTKTFDKLSYDWWNNFKIKFLKILFLCGKLKKRYINPFEWQYLPMNLSNHFCHFPFKRSYFWRIFWLFPSSFFFFDSLFVEKSQYERRYFIVKPASNYIDLLLFTFYHFSHVKLLTLLFSLFFLDK